MNTIKTIGLQEALPYLSSEPESKIITFCDSTGNLETFFSYKANLIEIHKEKMKIDLGKSTVEEVGEYLRSQIIRNLLYGYSTVLFFGANEEFDIMKFFSQFKWFTKDFFENMNYLNADYIRKNKILKEDEDWDIQHQFKGLWKVREEARIFFLSAIEGNLIESFLKVNSGVSLNPIKVE